MKPIVIIGSKNWKQWLCETLARLEMKVDIVLEKETEIMSQVAQDFESLRQAIDTATTAVGNKIADLSGQITNSMSASEVAHNPVP